MPSPDTAQENETEYVLDEHSASTWINVFQDVILLDLKNGEVSEEADQQIRIFLNLEPVFGDNIQPQSVDLLKNKIQTAVKGLKKLGYDPEIVNQLENLFKNLFKESISQETTSQIAQTTRENVELTYPSYQKPHFAFVDGVCKSILPRLEELERENRSLDSDDSLKKMIGKLLLSKKFPQVHELDLRQVEDLHLALPQIFSKLQRLAPTVARQILISTGDFVSELIRNLELRKDLIKTSSNKS